MNRIQIIFKFYLNVLDQLNAFSYLSPVLASHPVSPTAPFSSFFPNWMARMPCYTRHLFAQVSLFSSPTAITLKLKDSDKYFMSIALKHLRVHYALCFSVSIYSHLINAYWLPDKIVLWLISRIFMLLFNHYHCISLYLGYIF